MQQQRHAAAAAAAAAAPETTAAAEATEQLKQRQQFKCPAASAAHESSLLYYVIDSNSPFQAVRVHTATYVVPLPQNISMEKMECRPTRMQAAIVVLPGFLQFQPGFGLRNL